VLDAPVQSHVASIQDQNEKWNKVKAFVKAKSVEDLRRVQVTELVEAWFATEAGKHTASVPEWTLDESWLKADWQQSVSVSDLQVILGDTQDEGALYETLCALSKPKTEDGPPSIETVWNEIEYSLPGKATKILKAYGIGSSNCSTEQLISGTRHMLADISFNRASEIEAQRLMQNGVNVYRYVFDQKSPFLSTQSFGKAVHSLDLNYTFGGPEIFSAGVSNPEAERRLQKHMQKMWIAFANGQTPWAAQSDAHYYAFGPNGFTGEITQADFDKRRKTERWQAFDGLSRKELIAFGVACNKAFTNLLGYDV